MLHYRDQYKLDPDRDTAPADILGRTRNINRLVVGPACAFMLFYATGWPRCSLVYRIVPGEGEEVGRASHALGRGERGRPDRLQPAALRVRQPGQSLQSSAHRGPHSHAGC